MKIVRLISLKYLLFLQHIQKFRNLCNIVSVPPGDEGWLCPACDCKLDCIDFIDELIKSGLLLQAVFAWRSGCFYLEGSFGKLGFILEHLKNSVVVRIVGLPKTRVRDCSLACL